jgi:hypothetical protein
MDAVVYILCVEPPHDPGNRIELEYKVFASRAEAVGFKEAVEIDPETGAETGWYGTIRAVPGAALMDDDPATAAAAFEDEGIPLEHDVEG